MITISRIKKSPESTSVIVALKALGTKLNEAHKELQALGTTGSDPDLVVLKKKCKAAKLLGASCDALLKKARGFTGKASDSKK